MFSYRDASSATSASVTARRRLKRRGIVIHTTMGYNSLPWLQGGSAVAGAPASADFLIGRDARITRITRPGWYAYHSGKARWKLYSDPDGSINQGFIGIELEAAEQHAQVILDPQYIALGALLRHLLSGGSLPFNGICGHYECALPNGRKSDPLSLNWAILTRELISPSVESFGYLFPEVQL